MEYLVLDVGGSAIKYALMDQDAVIIEKGNVKTPNDSFESFREVIGKIYDQYKKRIEGIALSMPGVIDSDKGYCHTGGALRYNYNVEIVKLLQERCPVKIVVENDGKSAALGEYWKGGLQGTKNGVVVTLGTGIGGGIIIDGKLHKGSNFFAGEFSSLIVNNEFENGNELETSYWASQSGVRGLLYPLAKAKGVPKKEMDGLKAFELIHNKDEDALKIFNHYCRLIAIQMLNMVSLFDPDKIAIGGGISAQDILIENIEKQLHIIHNEYIEATGHTFYLLPKVVRCTLSNDANLVGALYSYLVTEGK